MSSVDAIVIPYTNYTNFMIQEKFWNFFFFFLKQVIIFDDDNDDYDNDDGRTSGAVTNESDRTEDLRRHNVTLSK